MDTEDIRNTLHHLHMVCHRDLNKKHGQILINVPCCEFVVTLFGGAAPLGAREALQHVDGMALSTPRGQGTILPLPTYTQCPRARSLAQALLATTACSYPM